MSKSFHFIRNDDLTCICSRRFSRFAVLYSSCHRWILKMRWLFSVSSQVLLDWRNCWQIVKFYFCLNEWSKSRGILWHNYPFPSYFHESSFSGFFFAFLSIPSRAFRIAFCSFRRFVLKGSILLVLCISYRRFDVGSILKFTFYFELFVKHQI